MSKSINDLDVYLVPQGEKGARTSAIKVKDLKQALIEKCKEEPPVEDIQKLAIFMHDTYEKKAKYREWDTQERCRTKFDDLPLANKLVMLDVAEEVLKILRKDAFMRFGNIKESDLK